MFRVQLGNGSPLQWRTSNAAKAASKPWHLAVHQILQRMLLAEINVTSKIRVASQCCFLVLWPRPKETYLTWVTQCNVDKFTDTIVESLVDSVFHSFVCVRLIFIYHHRETLGFQLRLK